MRFKSDNDDIEYCWTCLVAKKRNHVENYKVIKLINL